MKVKYELMAPAGNFAMLTAAVIAGADAVYFGLEDFSMRAKSKNFSFKDLSKIRKVCDRSERKVKIYLTLNTIVYEEELKKIERIISRLKGKVDAVICWDHAVMILCRKYKIPFFISTQASVANTSSAEYYKKMGAKRVVLARELNLKQIKQISKIIEVECFAHGAMCVAISGRCFMSQFTENRSANRGECIQNCRRSYIVSDDAGNQLRVENSRVMSAKDLCTLPIIEKLKKAGITSFKIEGRGRDARYVDTVTKIYRQALDHKLSKEEIDFYLIELKKVFNRDFSTGFYMGMPTKDDFSGVENSKATEVKLSVGKIVNYYPRQKAAAIKLTSELKIGDEIIVIGNKTGLVSTKIESMQQNNLPVKKAVKGDEVGIKVEGVRRNDEVYKIVKK